MNVRRHAVGSTPHRGFTLVEMMIAIVLALTLLAGLVTIFVTNRQTYRLQDALARNQENGRYALTFLGRDLRMAGFSGCGGAAISPVSLLNSTPSDAADQLRWGFTTAIQGYDGPSSFPLKNSLDPVPVANSDILVIMATTGCGDTVIEKQKDTSGNQASLKVSAHATCFDDKDIIMVTDCVDAVIFQASQVQEPHSQNDFTTVVHNKNSKDTPGNGSKSLEKDYRGGEIYGVSTNFYYVGEAKPATRGVRALYRQTSRRLAQGLPPEELVEGVDRLEVLYGRDTTGDRRVNDYRTATEIRAASPPDWPNVLSVRLELLMHSADQFVTEANAKQVYQFDGSNVTAGDQRLRQVFTEVVAVRNRVP
jgi:type IV pilus assembly protein PilW